MSARDTSRPTAAAKAAARRFAGYASPRIAIEALRNAVAQSDALFPLSVIGLLAGFVSGLVIVAFRLLTEHALVRAGLMDNAENFEALNWQWRLALPIAGGLARPCGQAPGKWDRHMS